MSESNFSMANETISEEYNWGFLAFSVLPVLAILGNVLVISSVIWEKTLQTSTNWLIVSLAFADFLVGLIVMPWGIYSLVSLLSLITYYTKSHYVNVKKIDYWNFQRVFLFPLLNQLIKKFNYKKIFLILYTPHEQVSA